MRGKVEVVQDGQHAAAGRGMCARQPHDESWWARSRLAGRLVEEQVAGAAVPGRGRKLDEDAGEMDALLLAAGQRS